MSEQPNFGAPALWIDGADPYILIPSAVVEAARRRMRTELLERFNGDQRRLREAPIFGYVTLSSVEVQGVSTAQARRMLEWCGRDPRIAFVERERRSRHSMREWALPRRLYEMLRVEALAHWQTVGYRVGEVMPAIGEGP